MKVIFLIAILILTGCATSDLNRLDPAGDTIRTNKTVDLRAIGSAWFSEGKENIKISKDFALTTAIYSIAAYEVYDKSPSKFEAIPFPEFESWQKILPDKQDPNTGFFGRSWLREMDGGEKEIIIVYRGTKFTELADWTRGNLVFTNFGLLDDQYGQALEYAQEVLSEFSAEQLIQLKIKIVGHSLGGGLAQFVQRYIYSSQAIVFAPSPNKGRLRSFFYKDQINPNDSIRIFEKGEFLQYLRWPFDPDFDFGGDTVESEGMKTRWVDSYKGSLISQHDMQDLCLEILKISASASVNTYNRKISVNVIEQLEMRRSLTDLEHDYYKLSCKFCERKVIREKVIKVKGGS
ncbi:hypothetical protein Q4520_16420 [Alteromonas sp. 1_MG-2023]|uniref:DUF6792 domain-containing protein n=1 Tax=Alteromonas sp. 1_MG-2023 TaxID=3062669 RepID=UPI0026E29CD1|nr:DUF6792 domain-containing protein [Alteromonas sp. 1_MG-2023]MDO6477010.1 hypothetical protein [Alteromonas sp. 1_MG-2023]